MQNRVFEIEVRINTANADKQVKKLEAELKDVAKTTKANVGSTDNFNRSLNELNGDLKRATNSLKTTDKQMDNFSSATKKATQETKSFSDAFSDFDFTSNPLDSLLDVAGALPGKLGGVTTAAIGLATAMTALGTASAITVRELQLLSGLDTTSVQQLGRFADRFSLSAEQAADAAKDWDDKMGDFLNNQSGPFVDALKAVNQEAERYIGLPYPQAVARLQDDMQSANLTMVQQRNIMESLGSDTVKLINAGEDLGDVWDDVQRKSQGGIISPNAVKNIDDMRISMNDAKTSLSALSAELVAVASPAVVFVFETLDRLFRGWNLIIQGVTLSTYKLQLAWNKFTGDASDVLDINQQIYDLENAMRGIGQVSTDLGAEPTNNIEKYLDAYKNGTIKNVQLSKEFKASMIQLNAEIEKMISEKSKVGDELFISLFKERELITATNDAMRQRITFIDKLDGMNISDEQKELAIAYYDQNQAIRESILLENEKQSIAATNLKNTNDYIDRLEHELMLQGALNDEQRGRLETERQITELGANEAQAEKIRLLQEQISEQEKLNRLHEQQGDAIQSMTRNAINALDNTRESLIKLTADFIAFLAISNGMGNNNFLKGLTSSLGSNIMGFADGGNPPVASGRASLVGERGPELIVPRSATTVIPNHAMGGVTVAPQINFNGNVTGNDELQSMFSVFADEIASQTQRALRNNRR